MTETLVGSPGKDEIDIFFQLIGEEDREDYYSNFLMFSAMQRKGQAFFNALPPRFQAQLRGTIRDPFHKDDWKSVYEAVDWLTSKH